MKVHPLVTFLNVMLGFWLAGFYIVIFWYLVRGGFILEANQIVAGTELGLAIVVTCWYLWQLVFIFIKFLRDVIV